MEFRRRPFSFLFFSFLFYFILFYFFAYVHLCNRMNVSPIKGFAMSDILSKFDELLFVGECNLKEFSNITVVALTFMRYTNANMADHSVVARDES